MLHQRLASLVLSALLASACGGGTGTSTAHSDPNAPPKLADQPPVISEAWPPDHSQLPVITEPRPPDNSQPPIGSSDGSGGGSCESLCARYEANGCSPDNNCNASCNQIHSQPCPTEALALVDCALKQGYCPDDDDADDAIGQACLSQAQAYVACRSAIDDNNN